MTGAATSEKDLDLALAAELQRALLPKSCPTNCPHHVAAARNRMCAGVGGDFYDFIRIHNDQIALVIGDVMGHGVRASLIMTQIVGFLRSQSRSLSRPVQLVTTLNRMLIDLGGKVDSVLSCSLLYGLIDAPTGTGFFVNAGHPRPLVCRPGSVRSMHLGEPNILLGVEEFVPAEVCHTFDPGERLVMFTDGITDAANPDGERFGGARLVELASSHLAGDPDSCAEAVFRAVDEFRRGAGQMDDETVVVVDRI